MSLIPLRVIRYCFSFGSQSFAFAGLPVSLHQQRGLRPLHLHTVLTMISRVACALLRMPDCTHHVQVEQVPTR